MAWPISERWLAARDAGVSLLFELTCTTPDGTELTLDPISLSVSKKLGTNSSFTAETAIAVQDRNQEAIFRAVTSPGSVFHVRAGADFGALTREWIPMGRYVLSRNSWPYRESIRLSLTDCWQTLEQARFSSPYSPPGNTRADAVALMVNQAMPNVVIVNNLVGDGGSYQRGAAWERSRTESIQQIAKDGEFEAAFIADGTFRLRPNPVIQNGQVVARFTDASGNEISGDSNANIISLDREIPFDRMYNRVVVKPIDETQTWTPQMATVSESWHPRNPVNMGQQVGGGPLYVPYFYASPTITNAAVARSVAKVMLANVVNTSNPLRIDTYNQPHIEPGDTVGVTDEANIVSGFWLVEEVSYDLMTGATSLTCRDTSLPEMEEEEA